MIFALLLTIVVGLALYETGYGVTNTLFRSLRKQLIVQGSAAVGLFANMVALGNLPELSPLNWAIQLGFLSMLAYTATATIKECHLTALASAVIGGLLFPLLLHMVGPNGYLTTLGFVDVAGAGIVHFVGGVVALFASVYTTHVIKKSQPIVIRPYSATVGFLILWAGWISYIALLSLPIMQSNAEVWLRGIVNMSSATAWGAVSAVVYMWLASGRVKMRTCTVGGLAGMVAMSADPFTAPLWGAAIIGGLGGLAATITYGYLCKFKVSDPSNGISIHMVPGLLGLLIIPMFSTAAFTSQLVGASVLLVLAGTMGVVACEVHNMTKPRISA